MGILSKIFSKIFPSSHAANTPAPAATAASASPATAETRAAGAPPSPTQAPPAQPQAMAQVDVEQMLDDKAAKAGEKLNWKTSIVDLLKLLDLDSSLNARKELAAELQYKGDTSDSASMNVWLHRQVMNKVAANGGKVPADLQD